MCTWRNITACFYGMVTAFLMAATVGPAHANTTAPQNIIPQDERAAVVFSYHRVGEDEYPTSNIRREQFESHILELRRGQFNVTPLPVIAAALKNGDRLPTRTVAITFDGAYKSIMKDAVPLLLQHKIPFTIFIATDNIEQPGAEYMDWDDVRRLARNDLVTFGLHPATYQRLATAPREEILRQINTARATFRERLSREPQIFAYPFGEYSKEYRDIVAEQGFDVAFGEQSGVAYAGTDLFALPRFAMTENYGDLDRFLMTARALPLPVSDISPADPRLDNPQPTIGFTVDAALKGRLKDLSCFATGQSKPHIEIVGDTRVEIRLDKPFTAERARVNCTLPRAAGETAEDPSWRWFGMMMTVPSNGVWADDEDGWMNIDESERGGTGSAGTLPDETRG